MMIRQRDPVALTDFAFRCARGAPHRRCTGHTCSVLAEYCGEEIGEVVCVRD